MRNTWEDLVEDFLEVACRINQAQRITALEHLRLDGITAEHLEVHPAFSIQGRLMVVVRGAEISKCILYFVRNGRFETMSLENALYR